MNKHKGFTIVELLIVIVVIAILAVIAIIAYNGIRQRAQDVSLKNDLANTGRVLSLWMVDHSMEELNSLYRSDGRTSTAAWITGENADNMLADSHLRWNDVTDLPTVVVGPNMTLEVVGQYSSTAAALAPEANARMLSDNSFCITGAVRDGNYNYRPMSGEPARYDTLLFYDSVFGRVVTMQELDEAERAGQTVTCEGHLQRWREARL